MMSIKCVNYSKVYSKVYATRVMYTLLIIAVIISTAHAAAILRLQLPSGRVIRLNAAEVTDNDVYNLIKVRRTFEVARLIPLRRPVTFWRCDKWCHFLGDASLSAAAPALALVNAGSSMISSFVDLGECITDDFVSRLVSKWHSNSLSRLLGKRTQRTQHTQHTQHTQNETVTMDNVTLSVNDTPLSLNPSSKGD